MSNTDPLLISAEQLAEKLQISARSVWRLLSKGEIIEPVRFGGTTRWHLAKVEAWIAEGCPVPSNAE
jgi:predicted DNA-binding transcriptional regulator AlpA